MTTTKSQNHEGKVVAYIDPEYPGNGGMYGKGTSPVTTYPTSGWTPLIPATALADMQRRLEAAEEVCAQWEAEGARYLEDAKQTPGIVAAAYRAMEVSLRTCATQLRTLLRGEMSPRQQKIVECFDILNDDDISTERLLQMVADQMRTDVGVVCDALYARHQESEHSGAPRT